MEAMVSVHKHRRASSIPVGSIEGGGPLCTSDEVGGGAHLRVHVLG
tara:strand:- start:9 stop:146 length:138 start_codon:yes stop_codon:yes gene_type:complete